MDEEEKWLSTKSDEEEDNDIFLTSDKILFHVQSLHQPTIRYIKTDFIKQRDRQNHPTIIHISPYWRNIPIEELTVDLERVEILITGHSDYEVNEDELDLLDNLPNLKLWICQNKNIRHPKLISIPIGITNATEPNSQIHQILGNTQHIMRILKTPKTIKNLAYLNISTNTYPSERSQVIHLYKDKPWVTFSQPQMTDQGHYDFLEAIYHHKFVFAPRGNGIDTHRLWEALYLRTIPIVRFCVGMEDFADLPILFVKEWTFEDGGAFDENDLHQKYDEIMNRCCCTKQLLEEKITFAGWKRFIDKYIISSSS